MIKKVEHIAIMVADLDRSVAFYHNILGLELGDQHPKPNGGIAFIKVGDVELELIAGSNTPYQQGDGVVNHLAFTVSDLDATLAHLKEHQVKIDTPDPIPIWDGMRVAFFRGPDGEKLELFERK